MDNLFPIKPVFPHGFVYFPDFLTEAEEKTLLVDLSQIQRHPFIFQGYEAKRKVASFGYDYSFDKKTLSQGEAVPSVFNSLLEKVAGKLMIKREAFAELLITEYPVGSVINWHRDAFPFDCIAGISLLSDCTFRLRPHDASEQHRSNVISFPVKRRSLYVIRGTARTHWQHSIAPVKSVRYSITLRTLKK
jgi:alkylated DNA repair dioxygenase AlkB